MLIPDKHGKTDSYLLKQHSFAAFLITIAKLVFRASLHVSFRMSGRTLADLLLLTHNFSLGENSYRILLDHLFNNGRKNKSMPAILFRYKQLLHIKSIVAELFERS
jgi:hypothetical protein